MRAALTLFLSSLTLCAAEPSAFGAGDLDHPAPYGLTSAEKNILKNKETLSDVKKKSRANESQVDSLLERVDGLQTIVEGLNQKAQGNQMEIKRFQDAKDLDETEQRLEKLDLVVKANEENIIKLKTVLDELSTLIDTINSNYVSKEEYNKLVEDVNQFKTLVSKELKSIRKSPKAVKKSSLSSGALATKAAANYKKKYYTKSIEQYKELIERKYKPAYAHYMIGEMWYYRKDYGQAIAYFKESAKRYDKASYMPTLMLHTAVSMKKTGDKKNADAFFNALMVKYPDSKAAALAEKELNK
ncbi:MAG: tetratricopeptide repeat protein [Campylobacterota bacterium]|nr:tetratricopeptide repeat protein [Campylobacterota bacterium]